MSHNEPDTMDTSDNNTIGLVDHSSPPQDLMMSTTVTDFARKLFKKVFSFIHTLPIVYIDQYSMLEDPSNQAIVCWSAQRDSFIVKDTNEFAKSILPRVFNHSNFASFVRQLNKYDFHKVKQTEFNQAGEQTSTFRHQDFHGDRPDSLQYIKRKLATTKVSGGTSSGSLPSEKSQSTEDSSSSLRYASSSNSNFNQSHSDNSQPSDMKVVVNQLREENEELKGRIQQLEKHHETMKGELKDMNRVVARQQGRTQLILNLLGSMGDESHTSVSPGTEHTRMPATATAVSMSMSTSGGVLDIAGNMRVPVQTDHFREIPRTIPSPSHRSLELQGRDIRMQSGGDQYGERGHFPTRSAGVPGVRFSEQSDVQHTIGLDPVHSASASAIVFGNLGQVGQATLMQSREVNRRTAPGQSSTSAGHDLGRHPRQWSRMEYGEEWLLAMSEGSHNPFPSPLPGQQASPDTAMSETSQDTEERPQLVGTASSRYNIHVENSVQQHDNGTSFEPAARGEFNDPPGGNERITHVGRRRGRSLSFGNDGDVQNSAVQGVGGFMRSQPGRGLENDNDHEMERGPRGAGNRQGSRRGSDSAAFVHRGDRGGGANVETRPLPLAVPDETLERWSFDTAPLSVHGHGMVHGLAISDLPPTTQTQTRDLNVDAMRRGVP